MKSAFVRFKYRRIEIPYITDIEILPSMFPNSNIPNGYEQIRLDLNEADLRLQINNIRNKPSNKKKNFNNNQRSQERDILTQTQVRMLSEIGADIAELKITEEEYE